jgi:DNA helicase INO80
LTIRDTERAYAEIEALDLSDVEHDADLFKKDKSEYMQKKNKRALEIQVAETQRRKRRRITLLQKWHDQFSAAADADRAAYVEVHKNEVEQEVRLREVEEDKERKKDQQRKRRREKAIADEKIKRDEAIQTLAEVQDEEEKARIQKDIERANKKIRDTEFRLAGKTPTKELRNESPHNQAALGRREKEVLMEGGLMTSFHSSRSMGEDATPEFVSGGRGRGGRGSRGGAGAGRARKSKEQKQAEKENAARAQMYLDQGEELPPLAPKEEERLKALGERPSFEREDSEGASEMTPAFDMQPTAGLTGMAKFDSKGYNQIYEQITRDISKAIPKVVRIKNNSLDTKASNARKTAQLAAKEARRWQLRTNKSTKDVAARAKRAMREMMGFWKRNERDEREGRKVAERHELDKAKKAEADREANRQKRKLNFLISQTELYSHFIGKKVKTDEIEKHGTG